MCAISKKALPLNSKPNDMNTIHAVVEIPLENVRSLKYEENIERLGEHENTCLICGKRVKDNMKSKQVHLLTNGNIVSYMGDDIEGSQGFFSVGNDCAKKLVIAFAQ